MKLFRDAKTSDGDPADEMAAAAVAGGGAGSSGGEGSCPSIVRSYGRLDEGAAKTAAAALASAPPSSSSSSLGSTGLVLQLLDGWKALAGPPSFASVSFGVNGSTFMPSALAFCTLMCGRQCTSQLMLAGSRPTSRGSRHAAPT